jgi:hypothetical protein
LAARATSFTVTLLEEARMKLPQGIETELLEYLHLEFGETAGSKGALKPEDLAYEGEAVVDGVPTHYWRVGRRKKLWATVAPVDDSYCLSTTTVPPVPQPKEDPYRFLRVEDSTGEIDLDIPLQELGEKASGLPSYHEIRLPRREKVGVLAEVNAGESPVFVEVSIEEGDKCVYVKAYVAIHLVYTTAKGNDLTVSIGPIEC